MPGNDPSAPEALLLQARKGAPAALGQLLERYRNYLLLLSRVQIGRQLHQKADPSDLVQETFVEAVKYFPTFQGTCEQEVTCWLRRILAARLANLIRHYCGTQKRDVRLEQRLNEELDASSLALDQNLLARQNSPSQESSRREQAVLLANALAQLSPEHREVIVLSHLEGLSFPAIALQMNRTVASVKGLWARALGKLKQAVGENP